MCARLAPAEIYPDAFASHPVASPSTTNGHPAAQSTAPSRRAAGPSPVAWLFGLSGVLIGTAAALYAARHRSTPARMSDHQVSGGRPQDEHEVNTFPPDVHETMTLATVPRSVSEEQMQ